MEQNIVVNGEYTESDPPNVHNKFIQNSQQYIKIKPLNGFAGTQFSRQEEMKDE